MAAANLHAAIYNIKQETDRARIATLVSQVRVPEFVPKTGVKIAVTDAEALNAGGGHSGKCRFLIGQHYDKPLSN